MKQVSTVVSTSAPAQSRAARTVSEIFESGRPLTYIRSVEEHRVGRVLREVAAGFRGTALPVWTWSLTEGLRADDGSIETGTEDPRHALDFIDGYCGPAVFHFKGFHDPVRASSVVGGLLSYNYESCLDQLKYVVIS